MLKKGGLMGVKMARNSDVYFTAENPSTGWLFGGEVSRDRSKRSFERLQAMGQGARKGSGKCSFWRGRASRGHRVLGGNQLTNTTTSENEMEDQHGVNFRYHSNQEVRRPGP